eukprot:m.307612 g.307612  ORF g.307612 m.307612 type:complete len:412 (+) comp20168_c0_seq1:57-1292(+)
MSLAEKALSAHTNTNRTAPPPARGRTPMAQPVDLEDPTPDIVDLFREYDQIYFGGALTAGGVSVGWSGPRMTLCAGVCKYRGALGGTEIVLSAPLLQFRSIKELKETLLHEMIHALLFVKQHNDNHEEHGPMFHSIMHDINRATCFDPHRPYEGYNIDVYHNFRDEVEHFRSHHWTCQRCQNVIKRSMNRTPSEKDCRHYRKDGSLWRHAQTPTTNKCGDRHCLVHNHMRLCGGEYVKTSEPPPKPKAKTKKRKQQDAKPAESDDRKRPRMTVAEMLTLAAAATATAGVEPTLVKEEPAAAAHRTNGENAGEPPVVLVLDSDDAEEPEEEEEGNDDEAENGSEDALSRGPMKDELRSSEKHVHAAEEAKSLSEAISALVAMGFSASAAAAAMRTSTSGLAGALEQLLPAKT